LIEDVAGEDVVLALSVTLTETENGEPVAELGVHVIEIEVEEGHPRLAGVFHA
jgi:hypothetical protein